MKKKIILIFLLIVLTVGCVVAIYRLVNPKVESFSLEMYSQEIEQFPKEEVLGKIETPREVKKAAKEIWKEIYGDSVAYRVPYHVFYDEANQVWLVTGSWGLIIPGGPHILISATDGKVLAVWHDKF